MEKNGEAIDRGISILFVEDSPNHAECVFRMFSSETSRIVQSSNVIWMGWLYHTRRNASLMQQLLIVSAPLSMYNSSENADIQMLKNATMPLSEEREGTSTSDSSS